MSCTHCQDNTTCYRDSTVRKTDRVLNKGDDVVVCLPGTKIEAITERVENIVGLGKGGSVLVHVGIWSEH